MRAPSRRAGRASSALSSAPPIPAGRTDARLKFFYGPMDCGKSTLALQINFNYARQGRHGLLLTQRDRSGEPAITSRVGLTDGAVEVFAGLDLRRMVADRWAAGHRIDYLIVDEAQFLAAEQVDQLAELVDDGSVDVLAFGLSTDFRSRMFPGSKRLFELADDVARLQVEVLCWCGRPATFNGRVVDGRLVTEGQQVLVADTMQSDSGISTIATSDSTADRTPGVRYQVLCRRHWRSGDIGAPAPGQQFLPWTETHHGQTPDG